MITGEVGFIDSNLIHYFSKDHPEYNVVNLDKLTYAENLKGVDNNPNYHFVKGDIANRNEITVLAGLTPVKR